jgi:hypothetical protein
MDKKKAIASTTIVATIAVAVCFLIFAGRRDDRLGFPGGHAAFNVEGKQAGETASGATASKRRAAEEEAARKLVVDFDLYIARIMTGDDSLDNARRMDMAYKLEQAIEFSPSLRAALKRRLGAAFKNNEVTALMELERAFNSSSAGTMALIDLYAQEVDRGGPLDYYAMQNISYFQGAIPEASRNELIESSFAQMSKYDDHQRYNGAMLFLSSVLRSDTPIPAQYRDRAIAAVQDKLARAEEGDPQYFAAQNLYKMMPAEEAAKRAESILEEQPTFSIARATLEAIVHGRMKVEPALIEILTRVAARQALSRDQSMALQDLLAQVPSPQQNSDGDG